MTAELWVLLLKTGGTAAAILIPLAWMFRNGGGVLIDVYFGRRRARGAAAGNRATREG